MGTIPPVIIVGSGRSGTTFLAKLLDSHPDVLYRHEPDSVLVNTDIPFLPVDKDIPKFIKPARHYLEALMTVNASKVNGQRPVFDKSYRSSLQRQRFLAGLYLVKAIERACGGALKNSLSIPDCVNRKYAGRVVPVIKTVNSLWRTRLFSEAMPDMRVLHIMRHPCAVVNSCLRGIDQNLMSSAVYLRPLFEAGFAENYSFTLEDLEAASYEEKAAFFWMACNQRIYDGLRGRGSYRPVIYEELCSALAPTMNSLFRFAGLDWNEQSARFADALEASDRQQADYFNVVRSPASAMNKWRDQLSTEQIERIEAVVSHSEIGRHFIKGTWRDALAAA